MRQLSVRTMLDRGRKAGLHTVELYQALAGRCPEGGDREAGRADQNGFVAGFSERGQLVYSPAAGRDRNA